MIPMFVPFMSEEAIAGAVQALRSRMIGEGETVKQFEAALEAKFGFRNALLLNNGTAGLRLALALCGVGPDDEVITTAMTCTATNTPILEQFATPVFADVQLDTGNIDPADIEHRIIDRTKAIICVDFGGYPCDLGQIRDMAWSHGLPVIEDAAQALGAMYCGLPIGVWTQFTMFSLQAIKTLTTVDGGILAVWDNRQYQEAKERRWFGIDRDHRKPSDEWPGYMDWPQVYPGYKYQPSNVQAAIGLGNLAHFDEVDSRRAEIAATYRRELANVPGLRLFESKADRKGSNWLFTVHVEKRRAFHDMMKAKDVETSVCHIRNDWHPVFGGLRHDLPVLDEFSKSYICLPIHQALTDGDVGQVIDAIRGGW